MVVDERIDIDQRTSMIKKKNNIGQMSVEFKRKKKGKP